MEHRIDVIPSGVSGALLDSTLSVLTDNDLAYRIVQDDPLSDAAAASSPPVLTILHGGELTVDILDTLRHLRESGTPTLALLEDLTEEQESILLDSGALGVLGIPATTRRLRTRVTSLYSFLVGRESRQMIDEHYTVDSLAIYPARREVTVEGQRVDLTKTEFDLLVVLARHPHEVLAHSDLIEETSHGGTIGAHALGTHLSRLRTKIREANGPTLVQAVRGVGYRLKP